MEFDSPDVAKDFPGLYLGETGKGKPLNEPETYDDESDKKKKKEKKDSKKDKGYAALAGESSHDEEDAVDSKSPGKTKKIKAFKLSTKKKDKKQQGDKEKEKEKERKSSEKEIKKSEKERKSSEKDKDKERKSMEKEKEKELKTIEKDVIRSRRPFSGEHLHLNKDLFKTPPAAQPKVGTSLSQCQSSSVDGKSSTSTGAVVSTLKEKTSALNAFLNAPAPIFVKKKDKEAKKTKEHKHSKDKEHKESKKEKDHSVSKVKLKLMRSKNSLEESQTADFPITTSHQFPEDPDSIAKEIRRYETLLEQTHTHIKGSKKVSKKQEEQLWELQRTLTQLKRKLRSVNALSSASSAVIQLHHPPPTVSSAVVQVHPFPPSSAPPISKPGKEIEKQTPSIPIPSEDKSKTEIPPALIEKEPMNSVIDDMQLDFTLKISPQDSFKIVPQKKPVPVVESPPKCEKFIESVSIGVTPRIHSDVNEVKTIKARRSLDLSDFQSTIANSIPHSNAIVEIDTSEESKITSTSPTPELERVQVEVHVHHKEQSISPEQINEAINDLDNSIDVVDEIDDTIESLEGTNKMIGSIHEELEDAAKTFGISEDFECSTPNTAFSLQSHIPPGTNYRRGSQDDQLESTTTTTQPRIFALGPYEDESNVLVSKSEPTLGDERNFHNDLDYSMDDYNEVSDDEFGRDDVADPFTLSVFETEEYLLLENEALVAFNEQILDNIRIEEAEVQALILQCNSLSKPIEDINRAEETVQLDDSDIVELVSLWRTTKIKNGTLNENVNRLRMLVATATLEHFLLENRLKYLEDKTGAISPLTTTTPLQTDV